MRIPHSRSLIALQSITRSLTLLSTISTTQNSPLHNSPRLWMLSANVSWQPCILAISVLVSPGCWCCILKLLGEVLAELRFYLECQHSKLQSSKPCPFAEVVAIESVWSETVVLVAWQKGIASRGCRTLAGRWKYSVSQSLRPSLTLSSRHRGEFDFSYHGFHCLIIESKLFQGESLQ